MRTDQGLRSRVVNWHYGAASDPSTVVVAASSAGAGTAEIARSLSLAPGDAEVIRPVELGSMTGMQVIINQTSELLTLDVLGAKDTFKNKVALFWALGLALGPLFIASVKQFDKADKFFNDDLKFKVLGEHPWAMVVLLSTVPISLGFAKAGCVTNCACCRKAKSSTSQSLVAEYYNKKSFYQWVGAALGNAIPDITVMVIAWAGHAETAEAIARHTQTGIAPLAKAGIGYLIGGFLHSQCKELPLREKAISAEIPLTMVFRRGT